MAINDFKFLDFDGLKAFNNQQKEHFRNRLKYKGDFAFDTTTTSFDAMAPTIEGHLYQLSGTTGDKATIDGVTYCVGDFVMVMNEVVAGGTGVEVIKLCSSVSAAIVDTNDLASEDVTKIFANSFYRQLVDTTAYKKGIYEYSNGTWNRVGMMPDEKTIIINDDGLMETAVGGWEDKGTVYFDVSGVTVDGTSDLLLTGTTSSEMDSLKGGDKIYLSIDGGTPTEYTLINTGMPYLRVMLASSEVLYIYTDGTKEVSDHYLYGRTFTGGTTVRMVATDSASTTIHKSDARFIDTDDQTTHVSTDDTKLYSTALVTDDVTTLDTKWTDSSREGAIIFQTDTVTTASGDTNEGGLWLYNKVLGKLQPLMDTITTSWDANRKMVMAKSAVTVATLPTTASEGMQKDILYRSTSDSTVGTTVYKAGFWTYDEDNSTWVEVGGQVFTDFVDFPTSNINENTIYRQWDSYPESATIYHLTSSAVTDGYEITATGLNKTSAPTGFWTWSAVEAGWTTTYASLFVEGEDTSANNIIRYNNVGSTTYTILMGTSVPMTEKGLWYYKNNEWHEIGSHTFEKVDVLPTTDVKEKTVYWLTTDNSFQVWNGTEWERIDERFIDLGLEGVLPSDTNADPGAIYQRELDVYTFDNTYTLTTDATTAGYLMDGTGLIDPDGNTIGWTEVADGWTTTYSALFIVDGGGQLYKAQYNGELCLTYGAEMSHPTKKELWIYYHDGWYLIYDSIGSSSTSGNYNKLINKPLLNGVTLESDKNTEDVKITWYGTQADYDALTTKYGYTLYVIHDESGTPVSVISYPTLSDKPQINGVELLGDKNSEELKITWIGTQTDYDAIDPKDPHTIYIINDGESTVVDSDYLMLTNLPQVNGITLTGNKTSSELDMYTSEEIDNMFASQRTIKVVTEKPTAPTANTTYYVKEGTTWHIYLYDSSLTECDLGTSSVDMSSFQTVVDNTLTTTSKNVPGAINELVTDKQSKADSTLTTTAKTVVGGINELVTDKQDKEDDDLDTTDKTVVGAINELVTDKQDKTDTNLQTTDKTVVGAINELVTNVPLIVNISPSQTTAVYTDVYAQTQSAFTAHRGVIGRITSSGKEYTLKDFNSSRAVFEAPDDTITITSAGVWSQTHKYVNFLSAVATVEILSSVDAGGRVGAIAADVPSNGEFLGWGASAVIGANASAYVEDVSSASTTVWSIDAITPTAGCKFQCVYFYKTYN